MIFAKEIWRVVKSPVFLVPFCAGLFSGACSWSLKYTDTDLGYNYLHLMIPDNVVFNVFVVFASLVTGFRTAHALSRYTDAAAYMHRLDACWFDAASTLIAFCRNSAANTTLIVNFEQTLIRLVSLLSALTLDGLQGESHGSGYQFNIIGVEELTFDTQQTILHSRHRVECAFQMIQQLVVDNMETKVLSIAPPILSRSFQELGAGLLTYHEAMKLAHVPFPCQYLLITQTILVCEALFFPWMMASYTRGKISAFFYTFFGVFLLWFLNAVATALDNPFKKLASTLDPEARHHEFSECLSQLLVQAKLPSPSIVVVSTEGPSLGKELSEGIPSRIENSISNRIFTMKSLKSWDKLTSNSSDRNHSDGILRSASLTPCRSPCEQRNSDQLPAQTDSARHLSRSGSGVLTLQSPCEQRNSDQLPTQMDSARHLSSSGLGSQSIKEIQAVFTCGVDHANDTFILEGSGAKPNSGSLPLTAIPTVISGGNSYSNFAGNLPQNQASSACEGGAAAPKPGSTPNNADARDDNGQRVIRIL